MLTYTSLVAVLAGLLAHARGNVSLRGELAQSCWDTNSGIRCHRDVLPSNLSSEADCTKLPRCESILLTGCGWCWDSEKTRGQVHGGRRGFVNGPSDGSCSDWTFFAASCYKHVDCEGDISTCEGIVGTYCGWCEKGGQGKAVKGSNGGPADSSVACDKWTWDHSKCTRSEGPEQVHLSFAGESGELYAVTFASASLGTVAGLRLHSSSSSAIRDSTSLKLVANSTHFTETNAGGFQYIHRVLFDGAMATPTPLLAGATYEYYVSLCYKSRCKERGPFFFVYRRKIDAGSSPLSIIVYGDMGRYGGAQVLGALKKELAGNGPTSSMNNTVDAIIHLGDFAYDLQSKNGLIGDTFLQQIEPLAAKVPYMICPGNHEPQGEESMSEYFTHYRNRFTMPRGMGSNSSADASGFDMWHSWNLGGVHFVSYSSETFFSASTETQERMINWIVGDLNKANELEARAQQPWVVAFGHRPMYCSNTDGDDCTKGESKVRTSGLEEVFHRGGVDLILEAHEHSYERLYPVYNYTVTETYAQQCKNDVGCLEAVKYINPSSAVHIITGMAGCNENDGKCINPIRRGRGQWSAFYLQSAGSYTYSRMTAYNSSSLNFQTVIAEEERVVDDVWIFADGHGPRKQHEKDPRIVI